MNHTFLSRDHRGLRPLGIFLPSLSICDKTICWNEHRKFLGGVFYRVSLVVPMHRCVWRAYVSSLSKSFHAQICDSFPSVKIDYSSWWLSRVKWLHFSSAMWSCNITLDLSLCVDFSFLQLAEVHQILRRLFFEMRFCNSFIIFIIIEAIIKNPTPTHLPLMQYVMHWILDFKCQLLKSPYICQRQGRCGARVINNDKPFFVNYDRKKEIVRFSTQLRTIMSGTNALLFDCIFNHVFAASRFHLVYCSAGRGRHRAAPWFILAIINKRLRMLEILLSALLHFAVLFCYLVFGPRFGCVCVFCSLFLDVLFPWYLVFAFFPFSLFFCYF